MPDVHARLSASSSERWMKCPGSMCLCKGLPESTSVYADEGTLAHSIGELKATKRYLGMGPKVYEEKLKKYQAHKLYGPEMLHCTDEYIELIDEVMQYHKNPTVALEKRISYADYAPGGFGTGDCVIVSPERLDICDYKHGKGVAVEVKENPQLMLYGLGELSRVAKEHPEYNIKTVGLHICQPRNGGNSSWIIPAADLLAWGEFEVKGRAQKAEECFNTTPDKLDESCIVPGDHCRFCKAKATCRERGTASAVEVFGKKDPHTYTDEELAAILARVDEYKKWAEDVKAHCLGRALSSNPVPGWKAVNGRNSRVFNPAAIQSLSLMGYDPDDFYEKKPLTVAKAEAVIGKKKMQELADVLYTTVPGKPTLAPETDKRQAISSAELAFADRELNENV